jgi:hypothetical protein
VLPTLISEITTVSEPSGKFILHMGFKAVDDFVRFCRVLNIPINPLLVDPFYQQLTACDGIISNTGFELSSECVVYGKNLLVKPPSDQYEKLCNIVALKLIGRTTIISILDR